MNPSEIDLKNVKIEDSKYINHAGKQILIKTDWLNCFFNTKYKSLNVPIDRKSDLFKLLRGIDKMVSEKLPKDMKQTKIIKEWFPISRNTIAVCDGLKDSDMKFDIKPKYKYATLFDENKKEIPLTNIELPNSECRFLFAVSPLKEFSGYYGTNLKCVQIQQRKKTIPKINFMMD